MKTKKVGKPKGLKKTGGRKKGTPNKVTADARTFVTDLLDKNQSQIEKDLKNLEPYERIKIYEKLLSYVLPKQTATDLKLNTASMTDADISRVANELLKNL